MNEDKVCKVCNKAKPTSEFPSKMSRGKLWHEPTCRLCKNLKLIKSKNILFDGYWSLEEYKILADNVLNEKIEFVNEVAPKLHNKTILDIASFMLSNKIKFGSKKVRFKTNCAICNKELIFDTRRIKEFNFCNQKCSGIFYSENFSGKNHWQYNRVAIKCDWCKKDIKVFPSKIEDGKHNFCNKSCSDEWFRNVYVKLPTTIQRNRKVAINNLTNGKISQVNSRPQIAINELLDDMKIIYKNEFIFDYYSIDNYLIDSKLAIEVHGDYFHTNPTIYKYILYQQQLNVVQRDRKKNTLITNHYKTPILYLWEHDIINNLELCRELIKYYIDSNGLIDDYNSFNYFINNGILMINTELIKPFQSYGAKELKQYIRFYEAKNEDFYITFNCDNCNKEVSRLKSDYDRVKTHFCSRRCVVDYKNKYEGHLVRCNYCNEEIRVANHRYKKNNTFFCNIECRKKYWKQQKVKT